MNFDDTVKEIGKRVRILREKSGETQEILGNVLGRSQNTISKIERGEVTLTLENLFIIAEHYNVSFDYLCTGNDINSFLDTLQKYVSLQFFQISESETISYPVLIFNPNFYEYLIHSARAKNTPNLPDNIRAKWLDQEVDNFYKRNKDDTNNNVFNNFIPVVPLPKALIESGSLDNEWTLTKLLKEINIYL